MAQTKTKRQTSAKAPAKKAVTHTVVAEPSDEEVRAIVDRYLKAIAVRAQVVQSFDGKPRSASQLRASLLAVQRKLKSAAGVKWLELRAQERDIAAQIDALSVPDKLTRQFVTVAKRYGDKLGLKAPAWREVGVPADVVRTAGYPLRGNTTRAADRTVRTMDTNDGRGFDCTFPECGRHSPNRVAIGIHVAKAHKVAKTDAGQYVHATGTV